VLASCELDLPRPSSIQNPRETWLEESLAVPISLLHWQYRSFDSCVRDNLLTPIYVDSSV
jgi:hypothetical protein